MLYRPFVPARETAHLVEGSKFRVSPFTAPASEGGRFPWHSPRKLQECLYTAYIVSLGMLLVDAHLTGTPHREARGRSETQRTDAELLQMPGTWATGLNANGG